MEILTVKDQGKSVLINKAISIAKDENLQEYKDVLVWIENGGIVEEQYTESEILDQTISNFIIMTDIHIQAEVEKYNVANGVKFASIHNCTTYKDVAGYPHQTFCQNIIQWNADIWEAVRAYQATNPVDPTDAEFQAELDKIPFAG